MNFNTYLDVEMHFVKVVRLLYTNYGVGILALSSNGIQKLWKWPNNEQNPTGKATANSAPQHWQPNSGLVMINDVVDVNLEKVAPCIDLYKNDSYIVSAVGRKVSFFNIMTFEVMTTFRPDDTPTFLVVYPCNNNVIAIGTKNGTIILYNVRVDEVKANFWGHHDKRITGLAFSTTDPSILVSSSADAKICVWDIGCGWQEERSYVRIRSPAGKVHSGDTHVMFHTDQLHLLVTHETQLAIYHISNMKRKRQWIPQGCLPAPISSATYSCNSQLVYASFIDGNIGEFEANNLTLRCRIAPSAYLSQPVLNSEGVVYAVVIAAHPQEPNQLAIGLTDGSIKVIEPLESGGEWERGISPLIDIEIQNGEDEERGESLDDDEDVEEYEAKESYAGQGVEVAMSEHNDSDRVQCQMVSNPECSDAKVTRLLYTNSGVDILALSSDIQKLWKWSNNEQNPSRKNWQPNSGPPMINDVSGVNLEEVVPCIALSNDDSYVVSAAGKKVSLFNIMTSEVTKTITSLPSASTFLAFDPHDNNIIAIAFSTKLKVLVSADADTQLCVWSTSLWKMRRSVHIQLPDGELPTGGDTQVMFHVDQVHLLVTHETQLAIYDASKMELVHQWIPGVFLSPRICSATYSCNSQLIYASFIDGNIGVFDADTLTLKCRIVPSAYLPHQLVLNGREDVYPVVIAAHPQEPNQFAIGLTDGSIKVIEPLESQGNWQVSPPVDDEMLNGRLVWQLLRRTFFALVYMCGCYSNDDSNS
nr:protein TPR1-like [Ipomoea batatas]